MNDLFTKRKFQQFDLPQQHKKCAELLRSIYEKLIHQELISLESYQQYLNWMQLLPFEYSALFKHIQQAGNVSDKDMQKIFNCGYGMLIFLSEQDEERLKMAANANVGETVNPLISYTILGHVVAK